MSDCINSGNVNVPMCFSYINIFSCCKNPPKKRQKKSHAFDAATVEQFGFLQDDSDDDHEVDCKDEIQEHSVDADAPLNVSQLH